MRGISNYVAAIITVAMIFTSIAFFISFMLRQIEISNYALNTMVEISDRAREDLGISYVFPDNQTIIITIVNRGTIETTLAYVLFIDKNFTVHEISVNASSIPISAVMNLRLQLPVPLNEIEAIKIATTRGNVFDVLSSLEKPLSITLMINTTSVSPSEYVEIIILVKNNLFRNVLFDESCINVSFIDHVTGKDVSSYFVKTNIFPAEPLVLPQGGQIIYRVTYKYGGGLSSGSIIDVVVNINTMTTVYEEIYSSATLYYAFQVSG